MPKLCLIFSGIVLLSLVGGRGFGYLEGQSFDKSWSTPLIGLLILGCLVGYAVTSVITLVSVIRRKVRWPWLFVMLVGPFCWFGVSQISTPSFTDGMADGLRKKIRPEPLLRFAEAARLEAGAADWPESSDRAIVLMKRDFPEIYHLSAAEPRVALGADYLEIFWGSALVKHWGIRIGSRPFGEAPADYLEGVSYREAYEGIWVYHDRY